MTALDLSSPIWTRSTPDDGGNNDVGQQSSIAIGTDGFPVISHRDETDDNLEVTKCNDAACAGGDETTTTVDGTGGAMSARTARSRSAPTASR